MIGIFVILIIAMILVVKFCKKTLKIALSSIIILVTLYCVMVSIDMNRVYSLREPVFAKFIQIETKDRYVTYRGVGYKIEIEKLDNQITSATMYMFNKVIAGAIT